MKRKQKNIYRQTNGASCKLVFFAFKYDDIEFTSLEVFYTYEWFICIYDKYHKKVTIDDEKIVINIFVYFYR